MRFHIFLPEQHVPTPDAVVMNTATTREITPTGRGYLGGENDLAGMAKIS